MKEGDYLVVCSSLKHKSFHDINRFCCSTRSCDWRLPSARTSPALFQTVPNMDINLDLTVDLSLDISLDLSLDPSLTVQMETEWQERAAVPINSVTIQPSRCHIECAVRRLLVI